MRDILPCYLDNFYVPVSKPTEDTRALLVRAATELVREEGVAGVGLRAITRRAGVSHGAPRRYFATHAALLAAAAHIAVDDLGATLTAATYGTDDPRGQLVAAAHAYVEFARTDSGMFELIFRHDLLDGSGENLRSATRPLFDAFTDVVGRVLPTASPEIVVERTLQLWASLHGIATLSANRSFEPLEVTVSTNGMVVGAIDAALRNP